MIEKSLKIAFAGTPEIGAGILEGMLGAGITISDVITQPDRPQGRSSQPIKSPVKNLAELNNISVHQPETKEALTSILKSIGPDVVVVAAYGMIVPSEALAVPKYGMINFHPSLLPLYRGPSPITAPILNGDQETGVTIIKMNEKMDEGGILAQERITLDGTETNPGLSIKLTEIGLKLLRSVLEQVEKIEPKEQDDKQASYTKLIKKTDGQIDWDSATASQIERMARAYTPWPGVYSFWNSKKIDFYEIEVMDNQLDPGEIRIKDNKIIIGTKKGSFSPSYLKIEGKNKVSVEEFLRGHKNIDGQKLK
jgi:methionyl-tRNA formyltransferase